MATVVTVGTDPGVLNLKTKRGDTIQAIQFDWGSSVDLSDRTWAAQARGDLDETEADPVAAFTVDDTNAGTGKLVIMLPASESRNLATPHPKPGGKPQAGKGTYFWDLQATSRTDAEDVKTWVAGEIAVTGDATVTA